MNKQNINSIQQISRHLYARILKNWLQGGGARTLLTQSLNLALKKLRPPIGHKIRLISLNSTQVELFIPKQKWAGVESDELLLVSARTAFSWLIHSHIHDQNFELRFQEYHIQRLSNFDQKELFVRQKIQPADLEVARLDLNNRRSAEISGSVLYFTSDEILVARIDATCRIELKSEITWGESNVSHDGH